MSPSTGVSCSTEASGLKPWSNTKNDRIPQTSHRKKKKNKLEEQPRSAKSSLNNVNHISKTVCNENVKHYVLNAKTELVCATCHECMFDAIHDQCVRDYLVVVNARVKSKSAKSKKKKTWKQTGKIYSSVGYRWVPTGRTNHTLVPGLRLLQAYDRAAFLAHQLHDADLLSRSRETNLYTIFLDDMLKPMRMESINGKKYILVIVDDYSRFMWVKFLRSKDEAPDIIIKCLKLIQVRMNATARNV
ncbi:retrovirus-related pol polyprotein from transposon TNT 1-94 [Tanacetum coccineum]